MVSLRVLVVDDDLASREAAVRLLGDWGHTTAGVGNGREAIDALKAAPYDIVLMDIIMPEVNGLDAARQVRRVDPRVVIIAVTGYDTPEVEKACRDAGISRVLPKPLDVDALGKVLQLS